MLASAPTIMFILLPRNKKPQGYVPRGASLATNMPDENSREMVYVPAADRSPDEVGVKPVDGAGVR